MFFVVQGWGREYVVDEASLKEFGNCEFWTSFVQRHTYTVVLQRVEYRQRWSDHGLLQVKKVAWSFLKLNQS